MNFYTAIGKPQFAITGATSYNVASMNESQVDVIQLQKRDPQAWTVLLSEQEGLDDVVVTAVVAQPLQSGVNDSMDRRLTRYLVSLANHSDPIPFIGKKTTAIEALFYRELAHEAADLTPRCWYTHLSDKEGWIILDDVPNHVVQEDWQSADVENIIGRMAMLHTTFWNQPDFYRQFGWVPHFIGHKQKRYSLDELKHEQAIWFERGPGALLSDHALLHLGRFTSKFLEAANGLAVMKALGGWPGVLSETHLAAAADLIDDPVPVLEPLKQLPLTLTHGRMHSGHWRMTLFEDHRLLDWQHVTRAPGICDLVHFQEKFDLIHNNSDRSLIQIRSYSPVTEETLIDSYMLAMKKQLGNLFDARQMRLAIPAARCLHVLTHWFPLFASWFDKMPNQYLWQRYNRMSQQELVGRALSPMSAYRPYLRVVFQRFLRAYRML